MKLRLLTWNIHKGIGGVDRRYDPDRVIDAIAHYEPDVTLLQEVDDGVKRSRFDRQIDRLGEALGIFHRAYGPNVRVRQGQYGNATLSRWPLPDVENIDLTVRPKKRRGVLFTRCHVELPGGGTRSLALFNLHLGLAGFERKIQMRRLLKSHPFDGFQKATPVVVAGDFNDLWGSLGRRFLAPEGFTRAGPLHRTYPAFYPLRPLDGIHLRGDIACDRCLCSRLKHARNASDHLPLVADLTFG